jgi:hypothetical protein
VFLERASEHDLAAIRTRDLTLHLAPGLALKNPPKKNKKKTPKKTTKNGFLGFLKFFIFYENNTNFSLSNRFFMNK